MEGLSRKKESIFVAAIDFGTTYSGYAFSFRHEFKENPGAVSTRQGGWNNGNLLSQKTPTVVLFDSNKKFHSFGYEAEDNFSNLTEEKKHRPWYFFKRFKMRLHDGKITRDIELEDHTGKKKMKAMIIFAAAINYFREQILTWLETCGTEVNDTHIHWVLTVPAIWTDAAKQFMRESACEAGIDGSRLTLAYEPEAAALFCQIPLPPDASLNSEGARFTMINPGTKYMVIDLGGGTADIAVHQKQADESIKEIHKASGGAWGGTKVDQEFFNMLIKIIGAPVVEKFKEVIMEEYLDLERAIEALKRKVKPSSNRPITMNVPVLLRELYEESEGESVTEAIKSSPFEGKIQWLKGKMKIAPEIFKGFFQVCSSKLIEHIEGLFKYPEVKGTDIFLMVGGFSESEMMTQSVKSSFPDVKVVVPKDAGLTVVKGAVIYGHMPSKINARALKYTYGINISPPFDPEKHREDHRVNVDGIDRCRDIFKIYMQEGDIVPVDHVSKGKHISLKAHQKEMMLKIFVTKKHDPMFVDEEDVEYVGPVVLELPDSPEKVKVEVTMMFGETELLVQAEEQSDSASNRRKKVTAFFDFI